VELIEPGEQTESSYPNEPLEVIERKLIMSDPKPPPWPGAVTPPQYEYAVTNVTASTSESDLVAALNAYGGEGWELVVSQGYYLIFKRPVNE
jgi:hypothetical protein